MKTGAFIFTSKRMVKEYVNRYVEGVEPISTKDIRVIGFNEDPSNFRILLSTPASEEYYGVHYDRENDNLDSYIYKKVGKKAEEKKSRNRFYNDYRYGREVDIQNDDNDDVDE